LIEESEQQQKHQNKGNDKEGLYLLVDAFSF